MEKMIMWDKYDNKYREVVDFKEVKETESELYEANNRINDLLDIVKQKDKMIQEMAEQLTTPIHDKEWVIKYFEERCK